MNQGLNYSSKEVKIICSALRLYRQLNWDGLTVEETKIVDKLLKQFKEG